ncbi:MAG: hypothetical protein ACYTG2_03595 [Planctomycetota bacterium]|jgi:hypothetical protein
MELNTRACLLLACLALTGMVSCTAPERPVAGPDDVASDAVWASLRRGDETGAAEAMGRLTDPVLRERARLDLLAYRDGRAAALVDCLDSGHWLAARYLASNEAALEVLAAARRLGERGASLWIEEARRSAPRGRRLSAVRAAQAQGPGAIEALALEVELLIAEGALARAGTRWAARPSDTARMRLVRHQLDARVGRLGAVVEGVVADLQSGRAVPASLSLLEVALRRGAAGGLESRMRVVLEEAPIVGRRMERARDRLLAILYARSGRLAEALSALDACRPLLPEEQAAHRRWTLRLAGGTGRTLEERLELDPSRTTGAELAARRLATEWDLAARESYRDVGRGESVPLPAFLDRLDGAARFLGATPVLADLPRREFGVFGTMLDTRSLEEALPDAVILGGQALTLPAELAWFDRVECTEVSLPEPWGKYRECLVRHPRVLGRLAAAGVSISGAGLDRLVYLDLDELEREQAGLALRLHETPQQARPAHGRAQRLSLAEPLDVVVRLHRRALAASEEGLEPLLLETIALHERQHILDFQAFVGQGLGGQLVTLAGAGLSPGSVRAAIERRAQLQALREASDPRIALAQAVSQLPVEGARRGDEHAVGYARLVEQFLQRLDAGSLPDGTEPESHGIDRGRVLLQQLDRLPPETIRAVALDLDD